MKRFTSVFRTVAGWQRLLALALAAVFVLSAAMSGTAAWRDVSQHRTNVAQGGGAPVPVGALLQKYERDADGAATTVPVPGAHFALYKRNPDGTAALMKTFITGSDGQALASDLEPGHYYWQEIHPAAGFLPETEDGQPKKYPFTVPSGDGGPVVSTAYNIRQRGRLAIVKTVKNGDNAPLTQQQKELLFEFTVTFSGGGSYPCTIGSVQSTIKSGDKIYLQSGQSAQFEDIPAGTLYEIIETPVQGYATGSENNAGNVPEQGVTASFTNTYAPEHGSLAVTKTVTGEGAGLDKEFTFTAVIGDSTETFTLKHGQTKTFGGIPLGTDYTVTEEDYTAGFYFPAGQGYSGTVQAKGAVITLPFVNHYLPPPYPPGPGSLEISKTVVGTGADPDKAFSFQVTFTGEGTPGSPQTFTLRAGEKKLFPEIPHGVAYTVTETDGGGYLPDFTTKSGGIVSGQADAVEFINRVTATPGDLWITVTKRVEGNAPESDRDKLFHFTLTINGEAHEFDLKPGETSEQFAIRPGEAYALVERDYTGDGYIQSGVVNGAGVAGGANIEIVKTNTYIGVERISVEGEKTWDLTGAPPGTQLPESITLRLKHGDAVVKTAVVQPGADGKWRYVFSGLPRYDALREEIHYTVEEVRIPGWTPVREGDTIRNIWQAPVIDDGIEVEKAITGTPPPGAAFTFALTPISGPSVGIPVPGSREITITGAGKASFGKITYTVPGQYVYTIAEKEGGLQGWSYDTSVYTLTVTVAEDSGGRLTASRALTKSGAPAGKALFTNRYSVSPETVSVRVTKVWAGEGGSRPQSVQAQLYRDGTAYGSPATLSAANNWSRTWNGLDKNHAWTVGEADVPEGYTASVTGDQVNGFVITNTKGGAAETTSVRVTKVWRGEDANRPKSVAMQLYKAGEAFDLPVTLSDANGWSYTWNGLEKGPKWTVDEVNVPAGYSKALTGDAANGFVITNTKLAFPPPPTEPPGTQPTGPTGPRPPSAEEIIISGQKTWNHGGNPVAKRPASITVIIKADGDIVTQRLITAAEHWGWAFRLPKYNGSGKEIAYTVDEARFEDYVKTVDGYNLINTYKPGSNTGETQPPGGRSPKTDDESNLAFWLACMILSLAAFVAIVLPWRRILRKGRPK